MATEPRVFTIPASARFLPTLIEALMEDRLGLGFKPGGDPLALAAATIYLPTRRACRLAHQMFLDVLKRDAAILPRIVPIGDVDEDEIAFAEAAIGTSAGETLDLPETLEGLQRKVLLAQLILKWAATPEMRGAGNFSLVANSPAAALALAGDLARLMDDMLTRQVPWDKLDDLVPTDMDEFWQKTLRFLQIARDLWPAILEARGAIEPAARRDRLIAAEAKRLATSAGPVIAAGSTGSIPATATLLATIAKLPQGALVLPGFDTDLDDATWTMIASRDGEAESLHGHPQFAMAALLQRIGIVRDAVSTLGKPGPHGRERIVSEALRPAVASELWQQRLTQPDFAAHADAALQSVAVIEAANAEEEALAIAVALREAMNDPDKTAALVTPDRALARRVLAALARWNVPVDDSGGDRALRHTGRRVCAAHRRGRARRAAAGHAARAAQASTVHARCPRDLDAGAGDPARSAPEARHGGTGSRAANLPRSSTANSTAGKRRRCIVPIRVSHSPIRSSTPQSISSPGSRRRWRRWKRLPSGPQPLAPSPERHAEAIWLRSAASPTSLPQAFDEIAKPATLPIEPRRLYRAVPRRHRGTSRAPAGAERTSPHLRPARSAPAIGRPPRGRRPRRGRLAAGDARRSLAQPPDASSSLASTCRSGASASRRTISRRRSARPR